MSFYYCLPVVEKYLKKCLCYMYLEMCLEKRIMGTNNCLDPFKRTILRTKNYLNARHTHPKVILNKHYLCIPGDHINFCFLDISSNFPYIFESLLWHRCLSVLQHIYHEMLVFSWQMILNCTMAFWVKGQILRNFPSHKYLSDKIKFRC